MSDYGLEILDEKGKVTLSTEDFTVRLIATARTNFGRLGYNESRIVNMPGVRPDMHVIVAPMRDYSQATGLHISSQYPNDPSYNAHEPWSTPYGVPGTDMVTLKAHGVNPNGYALYPFFDDYEKYWTRIVKASVTSHTIGDVAIYVFKEK